MKKAWLLGLVVLNLVVLLGQLWPEGAPPFARAVNIAFLVANLAFLVAAAAGARRPEVGAQPGA
jgi:hypothetical protein